MDMDESRKKDITIEILGLSNRSYRCLKSNNIDTLGQLLSIREEELYKISNLGAKSIKEINEIKIRLLNDEIDLYDNKKMTSMLTSKEFANEQKILDYIRKDNLVIESIRYYNSNGIVQYDMGIGELQLSTRSYNSLVNNGYRKVSEILSMKYIDLVSIKHLGKKCIEEIIDKIKHVTYIDYNNESLENNNNNEYIGELIDEYCKYSISVNSTSIKKYLYKFLLDHKGEISDKRMVFDLENNKNLVNRLYEDSRLYEEIKIHILNYLKKSNGVKQIYDINLIIPKHLRNTDVESKIIRQLLADNKIERIQDGYRFWYPSITEYINNGIESDRNIYILYQRIKGRTFEDIGNELGLTRERVRQLDVQAKSRLPRLREDDYAELFKKYAWTYEAFNKAYGVTIDSFSYLDNIYGRGNEKLEEFLCDNDVDFGIRKRVEKIIYKDYIIIDSIRIKKTKGEILDYILRTHCKDEISLNAVRELYYGFIHENCLEDKEELDYTERYWEATLSRQKNVLWKFKKILRYHDFNIVTAETIIDELNLKSYVEVEYSTLKFFNSYKDLMKEWDIRDEYELHNFLKKKLEQEEIDIRFCRMPNIQFGNSDRELQVLNMLIQNAPIKNDDLAQMYEDEYGVRADTVKANYFKCIDEYCHNSYYDINQKALNQDDFEKMKNLLNKEFYTILEVKRVFLSNIRNKDMSLINSYNLKRLGFKVNSNFIYSDRYLSSEECFRNVVMKEDIFDANILDYELYTNQSLYGVMQSLKEQYTILEFSYNKFLNIRRLENMGIGISKIEEFCNDVYDFAGDSIFTLQHLEKQGFSHELFELGFEEWFYSSLLKYDKRFSYRRLSGTILFMKGNDIITINDLIHYLIFRFRNIDIYDFIEYVLEEYGVKLEMYKLQQSVKESGMYYDQIMEKIYIDYDEYFEEV